VKSSKNPTLPEIIEEDGILLKKTKVRLNLERVALDSRRTDKLVALYV
jgi:hypothetical protein